ncbi:MAG: hypothetical protein JHC57_10485 [Sphingopyxis sp.]|uniref:hypothetical protein n=1 Tax=Sphingopyxis sp. TaxID=1908224 RepID=UPI001A215001|nr:hypothetical protein [Sphingopyxis sp.]MBJ7500168.1 hypothetical protein [Sphingopyxis sp.]
MADGEVSYLLLVQEADDEKTILSGVYPSLEKLYDQRQKSISMMLISFALLVLSYLEFVEEFGSAGLKVNPVYLKHFALMFSCVAGLNHALIDAKMSYFQTIFSYVFDRSDAKARARLLAHYPLAFDANQFSPTLRGYPKFVWPKRFHQFYPWAALSLIGLAAVLLLSVFISVSIAVDVWNSKGQIFVSRSIVVISVYVGLISIFVPKYWNIKRTYTHYGASELFRQLEERNPERARLLRRRAVKFGIARGLFEMPKD